MNNLRRSALVFMFCVLCWAASNGLAVTIPTVPVGNPGNLPDTTGYGSVSYHYRIGTTEVTNTQYAEFLNAKAASDPLELFSRGMEIAFWGGITRSGSDGNYTYATKANMGNKPVKSVSWYDAIRFANWLHNGQGSGDTETGAYTLLGGTPVPSNGDSITRNAGATWFLPSRDEWYKAAYHQPALQGGDVDDYWLYPTASNTVPIPATADSVGNISNPGANVANYDRGTDWNGSFFGNVTTVGSAGPFSDSFYGTADQGGNLVEWNEALMSGSRGFGGGSFFSTGALGLQSSSQDFGNPTEEYANVGFRVASVPEPSAYLLGAFALFGLLAFGRGARRLRER